MTLEMLGRLLTLTDTSLAPILNAKGADEASVRECIGVGTMYFNRFHGSAHGTKGSQDFNIHDWENWGKEAGYFTTLVATFDEEWYWSWWSVRYKRGDNLHRSLVDGLRTRGLA